MKYRLECKVDSLVLINNEITFERQGHEYIFKPNRDGYLSSISITTKVEKPQDFMAKFTLNAEGRGQDKLEIKSDKLLTQKLQEEMQYIETELMFGNSPTKN